MAKKDNEMFLRQYLVTGQDGDSKKAAFILHTCAKSANDEFQRKYPGYTLTGTTQTAASESITKQDMAGRDFWKEHVNWEQDMTVREADSAGKIRYFEMKDRAEKNLAALKSSNKASQVRQDAFRD